MKILLANDFKQIIGGTEVYMWSIKTELVKRGHEVKVYGSNLDTNEYIKSQKTKSISRYLKKLFNIKVYYEFKKLVKEFSPDIIHLHNIYNELSPAIVVASNSIPIVMTVHDSLLVNPVSNLSERTGKQCKERTCNGCMNCIGWKGMIYEKVRYTLYRIILKKVKMFITPSNFMKNFMIEAAFNPVIAIPNGINLPKHSEIKNYNKLLYIGRLSKDKGIQFLIKAMPYIINKLPHVHLNIVGDGPDRKYFEELVFALSLKDHITFIGSVEKDISYKYYKDTTIVIVPSIFPDNFPTVIIEALAIGRPVIGTNEGGIPELVDDGKTGLIITSKSVDSIVKKVIELLSNKSLIIQMSHYSIKKSLDYSLTNHLQKIESIYRKYSI